MIAIIDYGAGNLNSVKKAMDYIGADSVITSDPDEIKLADAIVLPGVGSFGFIVDSLRKKGLETPIKESILSGKPYLGICLGLQILFEESEESPGAKGLGVFRGRVLKFREGKVPQIGWNTVKPVKKGLFNEGYAYFVNSYYVKPEAEDKSIIAAQTGYSVDFASAVQCKNVTAVQFHPEKSGDYGIDLLRRWVECLQKG